jgi:hypothetical protein
LPTHPVQRKTLEDMCTAPLIGNVVANKEEAKVHACTVVSKPLNGQQDKLVNTAVAAGGSGGLDSVLAEPENRTLADVQQLAQGQQLLQRG